MSDLPDPALFDEQGMRAALACHDIATVYRLLNEADVSQLVIAALVGQSQSEVSEIRKGRRVMAYDVLARICEGLGIPRGYMGLAYDGASEGGEVEEVGEVDEEMKRRALLAVGTTALLGSPVLAEVLHIPVRPATPTPLPKRLGAADVAAMRDLTEGLRSVCRTYGGGAETVTAVATRSRSLLSIPATDQVKAELGSALAELHTLAGWTCVDSGHHDNARACFATAMDLAPYDAEQVASAFRHAGIQMIDAGAHHDGLKAYQLGMIKLSESGQSAEALAWLTGESALPLAAMGRADDAVHAISTARAYSQSDPFDDADMDYLTSCVYRRLGRLDIAEPFASSSVRKWAAEGTSHRDSVDADISLATIHTLAGEPDSTRLAHQAIQSVTALRSTRARTGLSRLVDALETRPSMDHRELARRARQVATTSV